MPHIASRELDSGAECPQCGAAVTVREVAARHSDRPEEPPTWVVANRFCSAGCVLLSSDFARLADDLRRPGTDD